LGRALRRCSARGWIAIPKPTVSAQPKLSPATMEDAVRSALFAAGQGSDTGRTATEQQSSGRVAKPDYPCGRPTN
jgi:hypothetical protein